MPMADVPNLIPAMPEIFLALVAMGLLMLGVCQKEGGEAEDRRTARLISRIGAVALLLTLLLVTTIANRGPSLSFGDLFIVDDFAVFVKVLVLIASCLSIIIAQDYLESQGMARFEYTVLILFATLGMLMMISANDLIALYLGLELQSLSLYVVATFQRNDVRSAEAGLKYFVLGSIASGMLLYGSSLVYGFAGTTNFATLARPSPISKGNRRRWGWSSASSSFWRACRSRCRPCRSTCGPRTCTRGRRRRLPRSSRWRRRSPPLPCSCASWWDRSAIWWRNGSRSSCSCPSRRWFWVRSRRSLRTNIKRLMAYSSIGHVGYALIGLAVGNEIGVRGVLIYMTIYLFMNIGVFSCILSMRRREKMIVGISDLAGLVEDQSADGDGAGDLHVFHGRHSAARRVLRKAVRLHGRR